MQQAILCVINSDKAYKKAAKVYSVPQTTLEKRVKIFQKNPDNKVVCENSEFK